MRVTLGSCWGHFGHMEVLLEHLGHFGLTLEPLEAHCGGIWGSFWRMKVALGGFGVVLGSL